MSVSLQAVNSDVSIGTGDPFNGHRARGPRRIPTASLSGGDATETFAHRTLVRRGDSLNVIFMTDAPLGSSD